MRHKKNKWKLSRPTDQRIALVRNQAAELFKHGYINTTMPRAKATASVAEKLITRAKRGDLSSIRYCAKCLPTKQDFRNLMRRVVPAQGDLNSGFTQIAKLKYRRGDGALVVRLSLQKYLPEGQG